MNISSSFPKNDPVAQVWFGDQLWWEQYTGLASVEHNASFTYQTSVGVYIAMHFFSLSNSTISSPAVSYLLQHKALYRCCHFPAPSQRQNRIPRRQHRRIPGCAGPTLMGISSGNVQVHLPPLTTTPLLCIKRLSCAGIARSYAAAQRAKTSPSYRC